MRDFVGRALKAQRDKGFAVTQADVMGHSMGGILTRLCIAMPTYKRPENFGQGDVRRLLTLDTPHSGSTFPNLVTALHRLKPTAADAAVRSITGFNPAGGAICYRPAPTPTASPSTPRRCKAYAVSWPWTSRPAAQSLAMPRP